MPWTRTCTGMSRAAMTPPWANMNHQKRCISAGRWGLTSSLMREPDEDESDHDRGRGPGGELGEDDEARWHRPVEDLEVEDRAGEGEERVAVIERECEHDDAEDDERGRAVGRVARGAVAGAPDLHQQPQQPQRQRQRGELSDRVQKVVTVACPPVGRHAPAVFARSRGDLRGRFRGRFRGHSRLPYGRTKRMVVSSLVCWIALAGSTPLGQTTEHSPTKLHSQIPSASPSTGRRSLSPWSRESRL